MPIEIRELVIRAIVEPADGSCGGTERAAAPDHAAQAAVVQACVAEVMRQLRLAGEP